MGALLPRRGRCGPPARRYDVGSVISIDPVVCSAVRFLGIPLEDAVRMASETPAEIWSLPEKRKTMLVGTNISFCATYF
jgi:N-acetylglucosamine-6-phosphate deacetylase